MFPGVSQISDWENSGCMYRVCWEGTTLLDETKSKFLRRIRVKCMRHLCVQLESTVSFTSEETQRIADIAKKRQAGLLGTGAERMSTNGKGNQKK